MATKTGNPFLDQDFGQLFDFTKYAEQFRMPNVDSKALIETQRKNIEAMTQANRVAFEGIQAIAQRQGEIVRQAMQETADAMQQLNTAGTPEERVAKQADLAKHSFETALKNVKELTEMGAKSNNEAIELLNKRVSENFDEMRETLKGFVKAQQAATPAGQQTKKAAA